MGAGVEPPIYTPGGSRALSALLLEFNVGAQRKYRSPQVTFA